MPERSISFTLNGEPVCVSGNPAESLLILLREKLDHYGTKEGCSRGECGACSVLLDSLAVNACLVPAGKVEGRSVWTIEGLTRTGEALPLQKAFMNRGAVQCGYCTPGMIVSACGLLRANPAPAAAEVKTAISGNLCRCSGYVQIEEAILSASVEMNAERENG